MNSHAHFLSLLSRGARACTSALVLLALSACLKPETITCANGDLCPEGWKCVTPEAQERSHKVCVFTDCGNGVLDPPKNGKREECDDGAETATCNDNCTIARCGDGKTNRSAGEECDDGGETAICNNDCTFAHCGDGRFNPRHMVDLNKHIIPDQPDFPEECDGDNKGNGGESENCNSDCTIARCGDGKHNPHHTVGAALIDNTVFKEECDGDNKGHGGETENCNDDCTTANCGDGKLNRHHTVESNKHVPIFGQPGQSDFTEECDDGRESEHCNSDCTIARCGDKKTNIAAHEECDEGKGTKTCTSDCKLTKCGNGITDRTQDESVQPGPAWVGEDCDDRAKNTEHCNDDCTYARCGDGKLNPNHTVEGTNHKEECDADDRCKGDTTKQCTGGETEKCNVDCTNTRCGDAKVNKTAGEKCDSGDARNGKPVCDYGIISCLVCNSTCDGYIPGTGDYCGDGKKTDSEICDEGAHNNMPTCPYGTPTCKVCNATCSGFIDGVGPHCGDGITNGTETCDDGAHNNVPICAYGNPSCKVCNATCSGFIDGVGPHCGDGITNGTETCDNGNTLGCGTCNASCTERLSPLPASGTITPVAKALLADGDLFILNDGVSQAVFELDFDNKVVGQRVRVDLSAAQDDSAVDVGNAIKSAIDSLKPPLRLSARVGSGTGVVTLDNRIDGSFGDRPIVSTVSASGFLVAGMSGGVTRGCSANTPCGSNGDCVPGTACVGGTCQTKNYKLTVQTSGEGSGAVTADVGALSCGSTCSASYPSNTLVDLRAIASDSSVFKNWSGDTICSTADVCPVLMDSDKSITATFSPSTYLLTVEVRGSGSVASGGTKIQCPGTCSASFTKSKEVTLTATPGATDGGTVTITWDGACNAASGTTCTLTMDAAKTVTVTFGN